MPKAKKLKVQSYEKSGGESFIEGLKKLQEDVGRSSDFEHDSDIARPESLTGDEDSEDTNKAAWVDESDEVVNVTVNEFKGHRIASTKNYQQVLEEKYESVMGVPKWAQPRKDDSDEILSRTGNLLKKSTLLGKGSIEIQKVGDLNKQTYSEGRILKSVLFHPSSTVGLVAGDSGVASIFQVDGKENEKLQSIRFKGFPILSCNFLRHGEELIAGSKYNSYLYSHDLITGRSDQVFLNKLTEISHAGRFSVSKDGKYIAIMGKFGNIYILSGKTKECIATLRMNCDVTSLTFHEDNMYSHGKDGEVYVWDMNSRTCIQKFTDDGCLTGTALAVSPNGKLIACGSSSGVVNIYDRGRILVDQSPIPLKTMYNLVTPIDSLKFNCSSEILCWGSSYKENAIRLLHCPSLTVFSNFPSQQANFHRVQCVDFSPNSGFLSFGNDSKVANMFRLKYYGNY